MYNVYFDILKRMFFLILIRKTSLIYTTFIWKDLNLGIIIISNLRYIKQA